MGGKGPNVSNMHRAKQKLFKSVTKLKDEVIGQSVGYSIMRFYMHVLARNKWKYIQLI